MMIAGTGKASPRVAMVVPVFPKASETFILNKFLGLVAAGVDAHIVAAEVDSNCEASIFKARGIDISGRIHRFWPHRRKIVAFALAPLSILVTGFLNPKGTLRYLTTPRRELLKGFYLNASLVALKPDIIHFEFGSLGKHRMHLKEVLECRTVVSFRGFDINLAPLGKTGYYDEVWNNTDALHFLGKDLWQRALRHGCPTTVPTVFIPPAIDLAFFDDASRHHSAIVGTSDRPLRILSVGRLEWQKGYDYALKAIQILRQRFTHCEYRIVGSGSYADPLAFQRHQLKLNEQVSFMGTLTPTQIKEQMRWADVLLHCSVSEGFCNAVIEAQAMKVPCVVSDAGGLPENVAHNETGYVVPRRNAEALVESLLKLAIRPDLRQQFGLKGRERVTINYGLPLQINRFQALYSTLLEWPHQGQGAVSLL